MFLLYKSMTREAKMKEGDLEKEIERLDRDTKEIMEATVTETAILYIRGREMSRYRYSASRTAVYVLVLEGPRSL